MDHTADMVIVAIQFIVVTVVELLAIVDLFLGHWMNQAGVSPQMQLFIMLFVAALLLMMSVRAFGPVLATLVLILLVLVLLHRVVPGMTGEFAMPGPLQSLPGAIHS